MATLNKLSIQGVRSVGPGEEDRVDVKFFRPFTLITGENGAGKTTIIEALKFASTGSFPPGAGKTNAGWIHHPKQTSSNLKRKKDGKSVQSGKVLSHITLEFNSPNVDGKGAKNIILRRNLEGTLKPAGGMSLKTLEGKITVRDPKTKQIEMQRTEKLEDLNQSVRKYLSISKPILEYVVFCHQEESLWPFEDSKKLKEKFDDIFQSSEYVKVMLQLKKERKTQQDNFRDSHKDTDKFKIYVTQREEYMNTVSKLGTEIESHNLEETKCREAIQPHKNRVKELEKRHTAFQEVLTEYSGTKRRLTDLTNDIDALKKKNDHIARLADQYEFDTVKINEAIESCINGEDRVKLETHIDQLNEAKSATDEELESHSDELNRRMEDKNAYHRELKTRNNELSKYARKFGLEFDPSEMTDEKCQTIFDHFATRLSQIEADQKSDENTYNEQLSTGEIGRQEIQNKRASYEAEIKMIKRRILEISGEERELQSVIDNASQNSAKFNRMKKKETTLNSEYGKTNWDEKGIHIDQQVKTLNDKKVQFDQRIEELEAEEEDSKIKQEKENEVKIKQAEFDQTSGKAVNLQTRLENDLSALPEFESIESVTTSEMNSWKLIYGKKLKTTELKLETVTRNVLEKEAESKTQNKQLTTIRRDLQNNRVKIEDECLSDLASEQASLTHCKLELDEIQEKLTAMEEGKKLFKQFMRTIKAKKCCPLCETSLKDKAKIDRAERICQENLEFKNKREMEQERDDLIAKVDKLELNITTLTFIETDEKREKDLERTLSALKKDLSKLRDEKNILIRDQKDFKSKDGVINVQTFQAFQDAQQKQNSQSICLATIHDQLKKVKNAKDYTLLRNELRNSKVSKKECESKIDSFQSERRSLDAKQRNLNQQLQTVREELNRLQQCLGGDTDTINAKLEKLTEEHESLETEQCRLTNMNNENSSKMKGADDQLKTLKQEFAEQKQKNDNSSEKLKTKLSMLRQTYKTFEQRFGSIDMDMLNSDISKCETKRSSLRERIDSLSKQILDLSSKRSTFSIRESNLKDALELTKKNEIKKSEAVRFKQQKEKLAAFSKTKGGVNLEAINVEIANEQNAVKDKETLFYTIQGRREEKVKQLAVEQERLKRKDIANAIENYKSSLIKEIVEKHVVEDIDKYHSALDQAIMAIHQEKMSRLNSVIGHLWKGTYQGSDIETIFVNAENDGPKTTTAANARRAFDYNVVMKRTDGATLNMRGRASAGQRVLASLIIRLALAECFCDCGILALDEPTTNLDRRNIKKFAQMLGELAHNASHQLKTQFIIITHDNEFVEQLCQFGAVEKFYHVSKNDKGYSTVKTKGTSAAVDNAGDYIAESDEDN